MARVISFPATEKDMGSLREALRVAARLIQANPKLPSIPEAWWNEAIDFVVAVAEQWKSPKELTPVRLPATLSETDRLEVERVYQASLEEAHALFVKDAAIQLMAALIHTRRAL